MQYITYQNNLYRVEREMGDELVIRKICSVLSTTGTLYYPDKKTKKISRSDDYTIDADFDGIVGP